jgi:nucleoside diphosphate kinase
MVKNSAFLFIKPHAVTDKVKALVADGLAKNDIKVVAEGALDAATIDKKMLIDNHYYAIASKATLLEPAELNVPAEKFQKKFGLGWQEALNKGLVYNAKQACEKLGLDAAGLDAEWAKCKKSGNLVKFGGGFYCGSIQGIYIFNGFFMAMRNKYVAPGTGIYYYVVEWESSKLSWEDFRGSVLGPTDPATGPEGCLRGLIYQNWEELGLSAQPNVGDNGVHASASPFEALAERMNWVGAKLEEDEFGAALLEAGISAKTIKAWSVDPQVTYGAASMPIKGSLFDALEDVDSDQCLALARMINAGTGSECPNKKAPSVAKEALVAAGFAVGFVVSMLTMKLLSK